MASGPVPGCRKWEDPAHFRILSKSKNPSVVTENASFSFELIRLPDDRKVRIEPKAGFMIINGPDKGDSIEISYPDIREIRLNYQVRTKFAPAYYSCELRHSDRRPLLLVAEAADPGQSADYERFITELHRHLKALQVQPAYRMGVRSKLTYFLVIGFFSFCYVALSAALIVGIANKGKVLAGAIFFVAMSVLFYFGMGWVKQLLFPGDYDPDAIPAHLMPGGEGLMG
jgi:hypothetical protein